LHLIEEIIERTHLIKSTKEVARESKEITDLESPNHAYVVAPNKIDEDRKKNLIKSIFKPWPPVQF
jgi:hypothetical protein